MLQSYTILELLLALAVFVLVAYELHGILEARRQGLSRNVSRVVIRGSMLVLVVVYAGFAWAYLPLELGEGGIQEVGTPTVPWGYLLLGMMLTLLAAIEGVSLARARQKGLTTNVSRLISHTVSFLVLLVMLGIAVRKWDHYMGRLELTIVEGPPGSEEVLQRRSESIEALEPVGESPVESEGEAVAEPFEEAASSDG